MCGVYMRVPVTRKRNERVSSMPPSALMKSVHQNNTQGIYMNLFMTSADNYM